MSRSTSRAEAPHRTRSTAWRAVPALLTLVACGRLGFDPFGDGAATGSNACGETCIAAGGVCQAGTCVIEVTGSGAVSCPAGLTCQIECTTATSCNAGIDCSQSTCTIDCLVTGSCSNGTIECGSGGCNEYCRADATCQNTQYQCTPACALTCCANQVCNGLSGNKTTQGGPCP